VQLKNNCKTIKAFLFALSKQLSAILFSSGAYPKQYSFFQQ